MVVMGSALRGTGIVQPAMIVQAATVLLNAVLAPVLIAGWGTGHPLGVAGAGLASTLSVAAGVVLLPLYFVRLEKYVGFDPAHWRPRPATWARMLNIGLPAGGEFAFMAFFAAVVYWVIRDFGAAAQAGFGIGTRVMQSIFLPAMAIAFAAAPIAGQNFGARHFGRVRATFAAAAWSIELRVMAALIARLPVLGASGSIRAFTYDAAVIERGRGVPPDHLLELHRQRASSSPARACSRRSATRGPSLSAAHRVMLLFAVPAVWLSTPAGFRARRHLASLGRDRGSPGDCQSMASADAVSSQARLLSRPQRAMRVLGRR